MRSLYRISVFCNCKGTFSGFADSCKYTDDDHECARRPFFGRAGSRASCDSQRNFSWKKLKISEKRLTSRLKVLYTERFAIAIRVNAYIAVCLEGEVEIAVSVHSLADCRIK